MTGQIEPRDFLVGDAEREHVAGLLQRAVGEGRITLDEFETRMAAAMAARTRGDLNALVLDIAEPTPLVKPKAVLELRSGMGDITRRGRWLAPPTIRVSNGMGDALLDFTEAQLSGPVTTIEVNLGVGDLLIVVPEGASVDYDDVRTGVGSIADKTTPGRSGMGPHFVLRGKSSMGDIKIVNQRVRRYGPLVVQRYPLRLRWGWDS
jgi:hypothetical protein